MRDQTETNPFTAAKKDVGDAVGVEIPRWYVAIVGNNTELSTAEKLAKLGYQTYVAAQDEIRVWKNGKRKKIKKVIVTSTVFILCTETQRRQIVTLPYVFRFMTNRAGSSAEGLCKPLAVIPPYQMQILRFMLGQSDIPVSITSDYRPGQRVRVIRGTMKGIEGEIIALADGNTELNIRIDILGCAKMQINPIDVEPA